jgi:preprotein translocase subunit SecF
LERVIDFLKYRWMAIGLSIAVITLFAVTTYMRGGFTWGIDFIGGVKLTVQFDGRMDPGDVRRELEKHGIKADVQQYGRGRCLTNSLFRPSSLKGASLPKKARKP